MPNRTEARSAKAACTHATGRLPLMRLFSTPLTVRIGGAERATRSRSFSVVRLRSNRTPTRNAGFQ
jgi:hypothetical protein